MQVYGRVERVQLEKKGEFEQLWGGQKRFDAPTRNFPKSKIESTQKIYFLY